MKTSYLLLILFLLAAPASKAQWVDKAMINGGVERQYRVYVPQGYDPDQAVPLVVGLHGLYGSMNDFEVTGITAIADTAGFLVVAPQALDYNSLAGLLPGVWNAGIILEIPGLGEMALNEDVDDVGFLNAMIDTIKADYLVQEDRVYMAGISLGGFMTQRMSCAAPERMAAVASIMGTYSLALPPCNPDKVLPMAHFHGTQDQVVTWDGAFIYGNAIIPVGYSVDELISSKVDLHQANTVPLYEQWPNTNNDSFWVEHYVYTDGNQLSKVELFKLNGGDHFWYNSQNTDGEIDLATELWKFFNRQYYGPSGISEAITLGNQVAVYPNPAVDQISIQSNLEINAYTLFDIYGRKVANKQFSGAGIDIRMLQAGTYLLQVTTTKGQRAAVTFVKR